MFKCLSVCVVSSGGIKVYGRKIGKIILLVLFSVVPDYRKSLTDLWCLMWIIFLDILAFGHRTEKRHNVFVFQASRKVIIPAYIGDKKVSIETDVVPDGLPLLLSKQSIKTARTTTDCK